MQIMILKRKNRGQYCRLFAMNILKTHFFPRTGEILNIDIKSDNEVHILRFNPMEFGILVDNVIYNSLKARAHNIIINVYGREGETIIEFMDDGVGLNSNITSTDKIFELGYTTTNRFGLVGLVLMLKKIVEDMGGVVTVDNEMKTGFKIEMRIRQ